MVHVSGQPERSLHWHASQSLTLLWLQLSAYSGWHFLLLGREEASESQVPCLARPETDIPVRGRGK